MRSNSRLLLALLILVSAACAPPAVLIAQTDEQLTAAPAASAATSDPPAPRPDRTPTSAENSVQTSKSTTASRRPSLQPKRPSVTKGPASTSTPAVRLMAVGDVMLGWEVGRQIKRRGPHAPWAKVDQILDQADLVAANLECVIAVGGTPWPSKLIHLRAPLAAADSLVAGGIDVVSVANNHALDFGREAFTNTLSLLDEQGIARAGGGSDAAAAHSPVILERNSLRIAFLGYVLPFSSRKSFSTTEWAAGANRAGLAIGTPEVVAHDVAQAAQQADVVIVSVHGGTEYRHSPIAKQRTFARTALDAGAALVLGHHPHVLQGYKSEGGTLVAYSLGNFMFARFHGASNDSAILDVTLTAEGVASLVWVPVVIERGVPRPAVGAEIPRIMGRLPQL